MWTCVNHLTDKNSQKYITDDALKLAFVTMMNEQIFGHQMVLRPLLQSLQGVNDQSRLHISGMALVPVTEKAGLKLYYGSTGKMLRNKKYLGDDY